MAWMFRKEIHIEKKDCKNGCRDQFCKHYYVWTDPGVFINQMKLMNFVSNVAISVYDKFSKNQMCQKPFQNVFPIAEWALVRCSAQNIYCEFFIWEIIVPK